MLGLKIILLLLLLLTECVFGMSLWDQVVKKEHVVLTVEYEGRYLNVWRQDSHGYSRFYVTPLCVMVIDSINCSRDEYSHIHRHIFEFNIKLWDSKAAKVVQNALKEKNIDASLSDILPLPMQMVRIGLAGKDLIPDVDNQWRSNQDQPHIMAFELYTRHEHFCNKMISDAKNNTKYFMRLLKPYFEFTMIIGQQETRNFNLTGKILQQSSIFSQLVNKHADNNGIVYLRSKDLDLLIRDLYNKAAFGEEVTSAYIPSEQENHIIKELFEIFKEQQIQSKVLTSDEWNSVFWDDIFTRPDIQTNYANEVLKYTAPQNYRVYEENENRFKFDAEKDKKFRQNLENKYSNNQNREISGKARASILGIIKFGGGGVRNSYENNENTEDTERNEKNTISFDDFNKTIHKNHLNIKWNGIKFEPKDLTLYRVNTRNVNLSNEIFFKRVIVTKVQTTQIIELRAEIKSNAAAGAAEVESSEPKESKCNVTAPFPPPIAKSTTCQPSWTYGTAGYCYKVYDNATWVDAENHCKIKNAHLASIHSLEESLFLADLADYPGSEVCDGYKFAWIGGYTDDNNAHWYWTDGTPFNYTAWPFSPNPTNSYQRSCTLKYLTTACNAHASSFDNWPCERILAKYICKKLPQL